MGGAVAAVGEAFGTSAAADAVVAEGVAAGTSVAEGIASGALTDLGGGIVMDGTGALIDAATGSALTDLGGGAFLNASTGALVDAAGQALPEVSSGVFQAADGSFLSAAGDPLTQSAVDGSFLNTATGEIIDATGGGAQAALNLADTGVTPEMLAKYGPMAYNVLNKILAPATTALSKGTNIKPGGLTMPNVNLASAPTISSSANSSDTTPVYGGDSQNYTLSDRDVSLNPAPLSNPSTSTQQTNIAPVNQSLMAYEPLPQLAGGGHINHHGHSGHTPEFYSEGGLKHRYVKGKGDGTSDDVPAMLANGEFVVPADVVSSLGNGSNDSGSKVLDSFLETIRSHKQKHDAKHLPPDSKGPLAYLLEAHKKVKL